MLVKRLFIAALFALPLAACEPEAEVGYEEDVYDQDALQEESALGEQEGLIGEDEERSAGILSEDEPGLDEEEAI